MEEKKKNPELRFEGFTDDWEETFAESLCSISTGNSNTQDNVEDGQYPFYVRSATIEKSDKYLFDEEAVLTVGDGVCTGKVYHYVNGKYDLHQRVYRMYDFQKITGKFFYYIFSRNFQQRVFAMTAKTSVDSVRMEMISKMKISYPSEILEQEKIEGIFSYIDELITKHQKKHKRLVILKKSMLEKLFPKEGQTVPEIRFKGYEGGWNEMTLGELCTITAGGTPSTIISEYWTPKQIPWMSSGEINKKNLWQTDNMISEKGIENSSAKWIPEKSVLIALAGQGKTRGTVAINHIPLSTNQSIAAMIPNGKLHFEFLFHNLENRYEELRSLSSGDGSRGGLNKQIISEVLIKCPSFDEQVKIGSYLNKIDLLSSRVTKQIERLKNIKKALSGKMFI